MNRLAQIAERTRALSSWIEALRNIWGLAALFGLVAFLLLRISVVRYGAWPTLIVLGGLAVAACLGFAIGWFAARVRLAVNDYSWESADYTYRFDPEDPLHHVQVARITIRANRHNVQLFRNRYWWTGVGDSQLRVRSPQHRLLADIVRDAWHYYYVLLEQALSKGGRTTVVVEHDLYDKDRMFQPMITKDVSEALVGLTMRVVFPAQMRPRKVLAAELVRSRDRHVYWQILKEREITVDDATGEVVFSVDRPRLGRRYRILWTWTGYPTAGIDPRPDRRDPDSPEALDDHEPFTINDPRN
jgi:hypothetical protein